MGMEINAGYGDYGNYAGRTVKGATGNARKKEMENTGAAEDTGKKETERTAGIAEEKAVIWSRETKGTAKAEKTEEYMRGLATLVPSAACSVGTSFASSQNGKTLTIHPKLLEKMQNDTATEKEMKELIKGAETAMTMLDSVMNAKGWSVVFKNDYIDENGKYHQVCLVRNDFMLNLSDELREERKKNEENLLERAKEKAAEQKKEISEAVKEKLEKKKEIGIEASEKTEKRQEIGIEASGKTEKRQEIGIEASEETEKNEDYLKKLQKGLSVMKLSVGEGFGSPKGAITHNITIHPKLLEKMQKDPEAEKLYMQRLQDIERASKLVNGFYHLKGRVEYHNDQWYLDENGNPQHFAQTVIRDTTNEKLREQAWKNEEQRIERAQENARKNVRQNAEKLKEEITQKKEERNAVDMQV